MVNVLTTTILILYLATSVYSINMAEAKPELVLQTGHSSLVRAVAVASDGGWVATASFDSTIRIWETASGRELRMIAGGGGGIRAMVASADGRLLASSAVDGVVRVWNIESGAELKAFEPISGSADGLAFGPDGKTVLAAGSEGKIWRLEISTGGQGPFGETGNSPINCLAFSPDGKFLAAGSSDKRVRIFDIATAKRLREIKGHETEITALKFGNKSSTLASGAKDGAVRVTRLPGGGEEAAFPGRGQRILALGFAADGSVAAADSSGTLRSFSIATKKESTARLPEETVSHLGEPESAVFDITAKIAIFGNGSGSAVVVDRLTGARVALFENNKAGLYGVAFSDDRRWMAAASYDNTVKLWDLVTGQALAPLAGHQARVRSVVFHPDNRRLISSGTDGKIIVWDTNGSAPLDRLDGHKGPVGSIAISPKGDLLLSASADGQVGVWDLANRTSPRFITHHRGEVTAVALGRDGSLGASTGIDGTLRIWDVVTGKSLSVIEPKAGELDTVAFSPDGRTIATAGIDKTIRLFEVDTGLPLSSITGHRGQVYSLAFHPDGKSLASGGIDGTVRLWPLDGTASGSVLTGHSGSVFLVSFAGNGDQLASASEDGSLIIWDLKNRSRALSILSLRGGRDWLVVSPLGFFDGSSAAWRQISWRFDNNTFISRPVEEFFSEFWSPGLLADLLATGNLPSEKDIATKDRRQPAVKLRIPAADSSQRVTQRSVDVRVEIDSAPAGAKDVRLFRNGTLVKFWRGDVLNGAKSVTLETIVPVVAGDNRFVAYAFNSDDIKSRDDTTVVFGTESLRRKGSMYVVAVGVNSYSNKEFDLSYAVRDADEFAREFVRQQRSIGSFETIEILRLVDNKATKADVLKAIYDVSKRAQPEDAVVIFYAGHGIADRERFYLILHDISWTGQRNNLDENAVRAISRGGISDIEIQSAVQDIPAENILLIIDACNSGRAIESTETRRGPFNTKGLAQLAYEKGMFVLTASQGFQDAKENARLGNGYLTFALIEDGLKAAKADRDPKDNTIMLREWLAYTAERVPQIDREESDTPARKTRKLEREKANPKKASLESNFQRPRVFLGRESKDREMMVAKVKD